MPMCGPTERRTASIGRGSATFWTLRVAGRFGQRLSSALPQPFGHARRRLPEPGDRLALSIVLEWGLRLALHIAWRSWGEPEDPHRAGHRAVALHPAPQLLRRRVRLVGAVRARQPGL